MPIDQSPSSNESLIRATHAEPPLVGGDAARESEQKYQRLVEGIGGDYVIYTHDPDGVITYVSPSVTQVLGYAEDEILGLNWRDLVGEHFIGRDIAERVSEEVAAGKDFYRFTVEISHGKGGRLLVEIQQRPLLGPNGEYLSMEGIAKDITEITTNAEELRKLKSDLEQRVAERTAELIRSNDQLRKSEQRYRNVVECQTEFVVRWGPGEVFTFVNDAFCRLMAQSPEELIGTSFRPRIHPEEVSAFDSAISQLTRENPYVDFENRLTAADGSIHWTHWTNQILFDEQGEFLEYQAVGRDVTALRNAADIIREKEADLAHMSRLATMGELVAGIAHEIHQPLHAAKTFAEAARRNLEMGAEENINTAIDCTNEISNAIARTAKIIRRLRDFTRSSAVKFEELDMQRVAQEASELIAFETRRAEVRLTFDLAKDLPIVQGDRVQLQQACINLLMNAYDAVADLPADDRQVIVTTSIHERRVRLSVADNGCGVEPENLDQLFTTFYSTKPQGMGMGLALCKSIAEVHGGNIWAERNGGAGMKFVLELPKLQRPTRTPSRE